MVHQSNVCNVQGTKITSRSTRCRPTTLLVSLIHNETPQVHKNISLKMRIDCRQLWVSSLQCKVKLKHSFVRDNTSLQSFRKETYPSSAYIEYSITKIITLTLKLNILQKNCKNQLKDLIEYKLTLISNISRFSNDFPIVSTEIKAGAVFANNFIHLTICKLEIIKNWHVWKNSKDSNLNIRQTFNWFFRVSFFDQNVNQTRKLIPAYIC